MGPQIEKFPANQIAGKNPTEKIAGKKVEVDSRLSFFAEEAQLPPL
jgi:hypothetical protein